MAKHKGSSNQYHEEEGVVFATEVGFEQPRQPSHRGEAVEGELRDGGGSDANSGAAEEAFGIRGGKK